MGNHQAGRDLLQFAIPHHVLWGFQDAILCYAWGVAVWLGGLCCAFLSGERVQWSIALLSLELDAGIIEEIDGCTFRFVGEVDE